MLFNSATFIFAFLPAVLLLYHFAYRFNKGRIAVLGILAASLVYYAWWDAKYIVLIGSSILLNYAMARWLGAAQHRRKLIYALGIILNLLILGYFKYMMFLVDNLNALFGFQFVIGKIVLPLGISFFTFQQISYLSDVYARRIDDTSLQKYATFITFFPHLIAGPILQYREIHDQVFAETPPRVTANSLLLGFSIFSLGLFKKVVIADTLAFFVNDGYGHPGSLTFVTAWTTTLSYSLQLYFDFSGYCDMATAIGRCFNIVVPVNFDSPYRSTSIKEFWQRWHITLGRFLREHIYFPLGGNRAGRARTMFNYFMTFFLGGIWHGAAWTFIFWGAAHGLAMVAQELWRQQNRWRLHPLLAGAVTLLFVHLAWIPFRAPSFDVSIRVLELLAKPQLGDFASLSGLTMANLVLIVALLPVVFWPRNSMFWHRNPTALTRGKVLRCAVLFGLALIFLGNNDVFLYYDF